MKTTTLCLAFDKDIEQAVDYYVALFSEVFGNSEIMCTTYFGEKEINELKNAPDLKEEIMPGVAGGVKTIRFMLDGQEIVAFNGGAYFGKFNESMSIYVSCETQEQIDALWARLSEGGVEQDCGWVQDRFGVSWQIAPSFLWEVVESADRDKVDRMSIALYAMKKIHIEKLRKSCGWE